MTIGDKIICIDTQDSDSLELNEEYIVVDINSHGNLGLKHPPTGSLLRHYYKPNRFKIAPEKPKYYVGQKWKHNGTVYVLAGLGIGGVSKYVLIDVDSGFSYGTIEPKKIGDVFHGYEDLFTEIKN